ncbi:MAG TPA: hypothetical protein VMR31_08295 [Myxococcota bacterium]|nr:hypothetical protein [Myxococcota bacterium]
MQIHRWALTAALSLLALAGLSRAAAAQTYVWTDERGVVHAAADPSEVPAQYRQKAVDNAQVQRPTMTVVPEAGGAPPASPMPVDPDAAPAPQAPHVHKPPAQQNAAPQHVEPNPDDPDPRTRKLGKPDPGFEWHCLTDPEGGPPKCTQEEKKYDKRQRRADAREKAEHDLGVTQEDEFDPDVAKKVNERAEEEFKKSTPTPSHGAPQPVNSDPDAEDQD